MPQAFKPTLPGSKETIIYNCRAERRYAHRTTLTTHSKWALPDMNYPQALCRAQPTGKGLTPHDPSGSVEGNAMASALESATPL